MTTDNRNVFSNVKKSILVAGMGILGMLTVVSCEKDNDSTTTKQGKVAISAKGKITNPNGSSSKTAKEVGPKIVLSDFLINLKEFELELDLDYDDDENEQWDNDGFYGYEDEIELEGPFELDLLSGEISFINIDVPVGTYEELEFDIDKSTDTNSEMFGKSILIKGTIDDVPFSFWHDFDEELEIDFEDSQKKIEIVESQTNLTIQFDLTQLLYGVGAVDLSQAVDGNNDGLIEISPEDQDGNNEIADQIKEKLKDIIDLLDD
ncbi:hypothetical protein [Arenibacter certesii]|uniref:DUF4382 domain-containing protein n=1 Tax=Arenibacter certesii TaxID=228955 RepID=A0A918MQT5_9FLAO|nr:hypothetical protein [Arenibacter certesii]GGW45519.1 hypothetical protein GCM10007383_32390 [Arenibacter certesii]